MLMTLDPEGRITYINPRGAQLLGASVDEVTGADWFGTFLPPRERLRVRAYFHDLVSGRAEPPDVYENAILRLDGAERTFAWHTRLEHSEHGEVVAIISSGEDVTERHQLEDRLTRTANRFRDLVTRAHDAIVAVDVASERFIEVNPAAERLFGVPRGTLVGQQNSLLSLPGVDRLADGETIDAVPLRVERPDGDVLDAEVTISRTRWQGREVAQAVVRDVTERRRAERALRRRDAILQALSSSTSRLLDADDWTEAIQGVLARLGHAADVQRVALYVGDPLGDVHLRAHWMSPDADVPLIAHLHADDAAVGSWLHALADGRIIQAHRDDPRDALALTRVGATALLGVAIFVHRTPWGFLTLDDGRGHRYFTAPEIDGLRAVADAIGAAVQRSLADARRRLAATVFARTSDPVLVTDPNGLITAVNDAFVAVSGFSEAELVGNTPRMFRSGRHDGDFFTAMWSALREKGEWRGEVWNRSAGGELWSKWASISAVTDDAGRTSHYVAIFSDISPLKQEHAELVRRAHCDPLTGLPNRAAFNERLEHTLQHTRRNGETAGVLFLDLDGFKGVNDTWGHHAGDVLLLAMAERLGGCVRDNDTVARIAGDEFAVALASLRHADDAALVARKIIESVHEPIDIDGNTLQLDVSIGIALFPDDAVSASALVRHADAAMYRAKASGGSTFAFYTEELTRAADQRRQLEDELRQAIDAGAFVVHYQPIVAAETGVIVGAEALVRWRHPAHGLLSPRHFLEVAEDSGLIVPIGRLVLRQAAAECAAWAPLDDTAARVSVNIAQRQLVDRTLATDVEHILQQCALEPWRLELEIPASALVEADARAIGTLHDLAALGVGLSATGLGAEPVDLRRLAELPLRRVKIDSGVTRLLLEDPSQRSIARAAAGIGHALSTAVAAEGVRSDQQASYLLQIGCDELQGRHFHPPMPGESVRHVLSGQREFTP